MKRNPSIERLFRWRFLSHEKTPKSIIPPGSVVRLIRVDEGWGSNLTVGDEFRIGYYSRQDGPNCVWLVDRNAKYCQTWDQDSLLDYFEIIWTSSEIDIYGLQRPALKAL